MISANSRSHWDDELSVFFVFYMKNLPLINSQVLVMHHDFPQIFFFLPSDSKVHKPSIETICCMVFCGLNYSGIRGSWSLPIHCTHLCMPLVPDSSFSSDGFSFKSVAVDRSFGETLHLIILRGVVELLDDEQFWIHRF